MSRSQGQRDSMGRSTVCGKSAGILEILGIQVNRRVGLLLRVELCLPLQPQLCSFNTLKS